MKPVVFMVDDEEALVWSVRQAFERERPGVQFRGFTSPVDALGAIRLAPPELLITDVRMPQMSGIELLLSARQVAPDLPVVVFTAYGGAGVLAEIGSKSGVEYLEKPAPMERLLTTADRLLERDRGFSGAISLPLLPDLVQIYTLSMATGALSIRRGADAGTIWFERGEIVHAECGALSGESAVYELLAWQSGSFSLDTSARTQARTIEAKWQTLLLEGCRLLDEATRQPEAAAPAESEAQVAVSSAPDSQLAPARAYLARLVPLVREVSVAIALDLRGDRAHCEVGPPEAALRSLAPFRELLDAAHRIVGTPGAETRIEIVGQGMVIAAWSERATSSGALVGALADDSSKVARFRSALARV